MVGHCCHVPPEQHCKSTSCICQVLCHNADSAIAIVYPGRYTIDTGWHAVDILTVQLVRLSMSLLEPSILTP
jgi:hypothetical protein